jgi:hypothetical protein
MAIGGVCLAATLATSGLVAPADAQMMQQVDASPINGSQTSGFDPLDPQWAFADPFMAPGFGVGSIGMNQQAYITKFGSGTVGLFAESSAQGSSNFFGAPSIPSASLRQDWFSNLGDSVSRTSIFGSYKSVPGTALFDGLYTTASFGVTSISINPQGFSGLPNFSGNDVTAVSARAGLGLQLTPQISIEGSVGFTQGALSTFR